MDAEPCPALEVQRKAHPDLNEDIEQLQGYLNTKLYHQLTEATLVYLGKPPLASAPPAELLEFFDGFVRPLEAKLDKIKFVQLLAIVCKPQAHDKALEILAPFEEPMSEDRDSKCLWRSLKAEKLTLSGQHDAAKDILDIVGKEIEDAYEVDAVIQSTFHKTHALLWKNMGMPHKFYKSSILYLAYTPLDKIPESERAELAFTIGVAALISEEEFDFGELSRQDLLASLDGSTRGWIKDLLSAFGEGRFDTYDAALAKHRSQIDATPELKAAEASVLRPKMAALALMELAFRKPKKQRRLTFEEVAQHCRVGPKEVEHLVMKAMCANLVKGKIDEVAQLVMVTWVKPRILDAVRIDLMRERMDAWAAQTGLLLDHLEEMTPELLVS